MSRIASLNSKPFRRLFCGGGEDTITGVTLAGGETGAASDELCIELAEEVPPGMPYPDNAGLLCPAPGGVTDGRTDEFWTGGSCREPVKG